MPSFSYNIRSHPSRNARGKNRSSSTQQKLRCYQSGTLFSSLQRLPRRSSSDQAKYVPATIFIIICMLTVSIRNLEQGLLVSVVLLTSFISSSNCWDESNQSSFQLCFIDEPDTTKAGQELGNMVLLIMQTTISLVLSKLLAERHFLNANHHLFCYLSTTEE